MSRAATPHDAVAEKATAAATKEGLRNISFTDASNAPKRVAGILGPEEREGRD
jgi:hypothetical protein